MSTNWTIQCEGEGYKIVGLRAWTKGDVGEAELYHFEDARLVVAARDLLEASELMIKACHESALSVSLIPEISEALQFAKMAVNKAKGGR